MNRSDRVTATDHERDLLRKGAQAERRRVLDLIEKAIDELGTTRATFAPLSRLWTLVESGERE